MSAIEAEAVFIQIGLLMQTVSMICACKECFCITELSMQPIQITSVSIIYFGLYCNVLQTLIGLIPVTFDYRTILYLRVINACNVTRLTFGTCCIRRYMGHSITSVLEMQPRLCSVLCLAHAFRWNVCFRNSLRPSPAGRTASRCPMALRIRTNIYHALS